MVMQYAMEDSLGNVVYERRSPYLGTPLDMPGYERGYSEETARAIDAAVQRLTKEAFDKASAILQSRRKILERGARQLLEHETLTEGELTEIVGSEPMLPLPAPAKSAPAVKAG